MLDTDPDLGADLDEQRAARARRLSVARVVERDGVATSDTAWQVLAPARLAILDLTWAKRMAPYPEVAARLMGRAIDRSRRLATLTAGDPP